MSAFYLRPGAGFQIHLNTLLLRISSGLLTFWGLEESVEEVESRKRDDQMGKKRTTVGQWASQVKNKEEKWEAREEENRHCLHREYFALRVAGCYYIAVKP